MSARLKHFGWGREGEGFTAEEEAFVMSRAEARFGTTMKESASAPSLEDIRLEAIDGFGPSKFGEDAFDAFVGLLAMIEVVENRRPNYGSLHSREVTVWEGWILGQVLTDEP
jgi:hypothetical protein